MAKKASSITTHTDISEVVANCDHLSQPSVESRIFTIRGIQVIIDKDLAELYGVTTKRLNEQVRRNIRRFPVSFRFQLTTDETAEVVANCDRLSTLRFSPTMPFAFSEQGVAMLSSVLHSEEAVQRILATPETERNPRALHMATALYFKSSYERYSAMGKMIRIPVNIGMAVKGLEYQ